MISALTSWGSCGSKESLQYTIKFLRKSGICVHEDGSGLCSIMNGVLKHDMQIGTKQHLHQVSPKGLLLMYCFAEYFNCTVFLFSTRKKPTIIKPMERDDATRKFAALLSHQDSYMQKTTWFSLTRKDGLTPNPSTLTAPSSHANVSTNIVATRFMKDSKKTRYKSVFSSDELDIKVMKLLKIQVYQAYQRKWEEFLKKPGSSHTVDDFKKALSTKSLPKKVVSNMHTEMEKELGDIQAQWTNNVVNRLRNAKQISTAKYIKSFINDLKKKLANAQDAESQASGLSDSTYKENKAKEGKAGVDNDKPIGSEAGAGGAGTSGAGTGEELRSVSRSLKTTIHPRFDYGVFLRVITDFQVNCHSCIRGLSKAVGMLVNLVLAGQHAKKGKVSFFDIQAIDLFGCGLRKDFKPMAIIDDNGASVQEFFKDSGFWKILSFCIGRKTEGKTKIPLLTRIQKDLDLTDYVDFTTRSALQETCRMYHTNFSNIYSKKKQPNDAEDSACVATQGELVSTEDF